MNKFRVASLLILVACRSQGQPVNKDALTIQDFEKRVSDYMKLRKNALSDTSRLKPTDSPTKISNNQQDVASKIRAARSEAKQGDIFTPEIQTEFRRLIGIAMKGANATRVHQSLKRSEPVRPQLKINGEYPANVPVQSTPPTLLLNLPAVPKELEYRLVGRDLILRDTEANLIVDFMWRAIP